MGGRHLPDVDARLMSVPFSSQLVPNRTAFVVSHSCSRQEEAGKRKVEAERQTGP